MPGLLINLDDERLLRSYDRIGKAIVDYISDMGLCWEIEIARKIYFGKYINIISRQKPGLSYKPFIQWLIFSYKLQNNGRSLIDCVSSDCTGNINDYEKDALSSLKNTYESLYKVYSIENNCVSVKDIFTGKSLFIYDNLLAHNVKRYTGLFTRVVEINNRNIPIPGYSIMTNSLLKETEKFVNEKYNDYKNYNNISIHEFIESNSLMIHRYFLRFHI